MLFYMMVWAVPTLFALSPTRLSPTMRAVLLSTVATALTMIIGLRFEIGGDWFTYGVIHDAIVSAPAPLWLVASEPAYAVLNRLADDPNHGLIVVNLVCAAIYASGLVLLCRDQPLPALGLVVGIPYLTIVMAMGYTRQSAAFGLVCLGLVALRRGRVGAYAGLATAATLFHFSAFASLPLLLVKASPRLRVWAGIALAMILPAVLVASAGLLTGKFDAYITHGMSSEGALPRAVMNLIPALIYLGWRARFRARWPDDAAIWTTLSIAAFATTPLLAFASTAADRLNLLIAPLQIVVYTRLPLLLRGHWRAAAYTGVILLYGGVLALWLLTSFYAACCWIPYRWVL